MAATQGATSRYTSHLTKLRPLGFTLAVQIRSCTSRIVLNLLI